MSFQDMCGNVIVGSLTAGLVTLLVFCIVMVVKEMIKELRK